MLIERTVSAIVAIVILIVGLSGCTDKPIDDDHDEFDGFIMRDENDIEVVRVMDDSVHLNTITLAVDSTTSLSLLFLDGHGNGIIPDDDLAPRIEIVDSTLIDATVTTGAAWVVTLIGKSRGTAELSVVLRHGGHDDFRSPPLSVVVE